MFTPRISVVVPNYNHAAYLRQRLDSILGQTYPNFEVIILDDASQDMSREVIETYRHYPQVTHVVFNQANSGSAFQQWKKGLDLSTGEWIWFAESDDYADPDFLAKMIALIGDRQKVGLAYCDSVIVSSKLETADSFAIIKNKQYGTDRWSSEYLNNGLNEIENYLLSGSTINNTSAVLFKRSTLTEVDPFDVDLRYIGDKYAFVKVLSVTDVVYTPERLNFYRDPFNTKHADKFIYYFYEQFIVFDWVDRNLKINRGKFFASFYHNTRNSLLRGWNTEKLALYKKLFLLNPPLFLKCVVHNFKESIRSIFSN